MGTPQVVIPVLEALVATRHDVIGVVTQPDAKSGRGRVVAPSPLKEFAASNGLKVLQPASLRSKKFLAEIRGLAPELITVAAYGKILPEAVLALPRLGSINVHPSLLPKYRGASPVAASLSNGDNITGVSIMLMDKGMDTGPLLAQQQEIILPDDDTGRLTNRLFRRGAQLLVMTLERWVNRTVTPVPQDHSRATVSAVLVKTDGLLDFSRTAEQLVNQIRAFRPWPGAYTTWEGRRLKILEALSLFPNTEISEENPGTVISVREDATVSAAIVTSNGLLGLRRIQLEGKRPTDCGEFLRGYPEFVGAHLPNVESS